MAAEVIEPVQYGTHSQLRWSAIFGGAAVALGLWILLYVLGLAAGLSGMDPRDPSSARTAGIGTGIWSLIAPLIALFIGGWVSARLDVNINRLSSALHGAVLWGVTTIAGVLFVGTLLGSLVSGLFSAGRAGLSAAGNAAAAGAPSAGGAMSALGIDANSLLAPVNQRLQAAGKPQVTADQMQNVARDVTGTFVRQGSVDRATITSSVAQHTNLSQADAQEVAGTIEQQMQQLQSQGAAQLQQVQQGALRAADVSGKVLWGVFGALLLGLISAVAGAALGRVRPQLVETRREAPIGRPGEVRP